MSGLSPEVAIPVMRAAVLLESYRDLLKEFEVDTCGFVLRQFNACGALTVIGARDREIIAKVWAEPELSRRLAVANGAIQ